MTASRAAFLAGIVDGARPLHQRLLDAKARRVRVVIANALDGAPEVATARRFAAARPVELLAGLALAMRELGATRGLIALAAPAAEAQHALAGRLTDAARGVGAAGVPSSGIELVELADAAAGNDEAELVADLGDRGEPDAVVLGAVALAALGAGGPALMVPVTIAGAVLRPGVRVVPVGMSVEDVIDAAGGVTVGPAWLALGGGPLAGRPLDRDTPIELRTRALFVTAGDSDLARRTRLPLADRLRQSLSACEACAACTDVCPPALRGAGLAPHLILRALGGATDQPVLGALACTGCALCDLACPVGLAPHALVLAAARALRDRAADVDRELPSGTPHPLRAERRLSTRVAALRLGLGAPHGVGVGVDARESPPPPPWDPAPVEPARIAVPLLQWTGVPARPVVAPGMYVARGSRLAEPDAGTLSLPVHAPFAGFVGEVVPGRTGFVTLHRT